MKSIHRFRFLVLLAVLVPMRAYPAQEQGKVEGKLEKLEAHVESIGGDQTSLVVAYENKRLTLSVKAKDLQARIKNHQRGDRLLLEVTEEKGERILKDFTVKAVPVSREWRIGVLVVSLLVLLFLSMVFVGRDPRRLIVGEDNRYSNSKFQMTLWFGILMASYISALGLRWWEGGGDFIGGVNIPQNLLMLSGISALTLGLAKGITTSKVQASPGAKQPAAAPHFLFDLSHSDRQQPDIGDFQQLVITLVAAVTYLALAFHFLGTIELLKSVTLPDVDTTILATFGFGQGAYLAKKYAGGPGES